jgi:hypothetical protein
MRALKMDLIVEHDHNDPKVSSEDRNNHMEMKEKAPGSRTRANQ